MSNDSIVCSEMPVRIDKGCEVVHEDKRWVIQKNIGLTQVQARCLEGEFRETRILDVVNLRAPSEEKPTSGKTDVDIDMVSDEDWDIAKDRLIAIQPLLTRRRGIVEAARAEAKRIGVNIDTLYRWRNNYLATEKLSSLLPTKRPGGVGKGRIHPDVEAIMDDAISTIYEKGSEVSASQVHEDVVASCNERNLRPPDLKTFRRRIAWRDQKELFAKRKGKKVAARRFDALESNPDYALHSLHKSQIDHAVVDVIVVHDVTRQPLYRPWLTLIIDLYSRVVLGFYLSLEYPSSTSVGACMARAILPKEKYLSRMGANFSWPVWGVMQIVRADNGADFRGSRLAPSFREYGIERQFRPVKKPKYGAHIERLIGTFAKKFRILPGATTNKVDKDRDYSPEKSAAMTMLELEKWLLEEINKYHHTPHSGIGNEAPLALYERAFLRADPDRPVSLPARRTDEDRVEIDFLPEIERTIQRDGVGIDGRRYWSDVLAPWLGYREASNPSKNPLFRFKTDDRDVSRIFFWDKEQKAWFRIPSAYTGAADASRTEYRTARKAITKREGENPSERAIHDSIIRQREIRDQAIAKTVETKKVVRAKGTPKDKKVQLKKDQQQRDAVRRSAGKNVPQPAAVRVFVLPDIGDIPEKDGTL